MEHPKKLVRGLRDVSPIFESPGRLAVKDVHEAQILSVSTPHEDDDSLLLNTYVASRMASGIKPCSLISLLSRSSASCSWRSGVQKIESFGRHIKRHTLFWDELKDILEAGLQDPARLPESRSVLLDFEYQHLLYYPKILELLDKWILLLKPTPESLTEGYKMIKAGLTLNPHLDCFVLLQTKANPPSDSTIFERFAALASKHLKVHLGWLGWLDLSDRDHFFEAKLNVEQLHFRSCQARPSPEQLTLAKWVEAIEHKPGVLKTGEGALE